MGLRIICPVCDQRMTINLNSGLVKCMTCGYQPLHEWRKLSPEAPRTRLHPLIRTGGIKAHADLIECPNCKSSQLQPIPGQDVIECITCQTRYPIKTQADPHPESLRDVLLQRKNHQHVQRKITERTLDCQSCGASVSVPAYQFNKQCPFCRSQYVVLSDTEGSIPWPDGIVPFKVSPEKAQRLVASTLHSGWHGMTRLLRDRVVSYRLKPLYLPWWKFDITVNVYWRYPHGFSTGGTEAISVSSDPFYAALPDREEVPRLLPYELHDARAFRPEYTGNIQTHIPQLDVAHIAPNALQWAMKKAKTLVRRSRPDFMSHQTPTGDRQRSALQLSAHPVQVEYILLLLPVYVLLLREKDGDLRRALVNGQTGETHLEGSVLWGIFTDGGGKYNQFDEKL